MAIGGGLPGPLETRVGDSPGRVEILFIFVGGASPNRMTVLKGKGKANV